MIRQEWCDPKHPKAVELSLVQMATGHIEWVRSRDVRDGDVVKMVVVTSRLPITLARKADR